MLSRFEDIAVPMTDILDLLGDTPIPTPQRTYRDRMRDRYSELLLQYHSKTACWTLQTDAEMRYCESMMFLLFAYPVDLPEKATKKQVFYALAPHIAKYLCETYPACFFLRPQDRIPLRVGIFKDLCERNPKIPSGLLSTALAYYTRIHGYQKSLTTIPYRVDLDGNVAGPVRVEHVETAREELHRKSRGKANVAVGTKV